MVRKGQMHVLDAIAAVIVLLFFSIANFTGGGYSDWTEYENKIAAKDISYTIKQTGHLHNFMKRGETGNIKASISTLSERDLQVGGKIRGIPPNLDVGFHAHQDELTNITMERVTSGDRCHGELQELQDRSTTPLLRTATGAGTMEDQHGDVRLYFGKYNSQRPGLVYNAIWIDNGTECSFQNPSDPVFVGEIFEWGPGDDILEARAIYEQENFQGNFEVAEAGQMRRFKETMKTPVGEVNNRAEFDTFKIQDDLNQYDILVFRGTTSLEDIEGSRSQINGLVGNKPMLVLADLDQSYLENGDFLYDQGFRWKDIEYNATAEANCPTSGKTEISSGCNLRLEFSDVSRSQDLKGNILGQRTDLSGISLYPGGSVTYDEKGPISYEKIMYLKNYKYSEISEDRIDKSMSPTTASGRPSTVCNNATQATFNFPTLNGGMDSMDVVNTQLGQTTSYCDRNNRAIYIDLDEDGEYTGDREGPYLDGEKIEINGITYRVNIFSDLAANCGTDNCVGFRADENANINVFNFNENKLVGRGPYEESYSEADRKVLSSFMYSMVGSTELPTATRGQITTGVYGVLGEDSYRINLRWTN